eukprot:5216377-Amphidinium_carterae.1
MLSTLRGSMFERHGVNWNDPKMKSFRTPDHPLWGTCLTVSLVRAGYQKIFVKWAMESMYTNPVSGCRARLTDTSLRYEPTIIVAHVQTQNQDGSVE